MRVERARNVLEKSVSSELSSVAPHSGPFRLISRPAPVVPLRYRGEIYHHGDADTETWLHSRWSLDNPAQNTMSPLGWRRAAGLPSRSMRIHAKYIRSSWFFQEKFLAIVGLSHSRRYGVSVGSNQGTRLFPRFSTCYEHASAGAATGRA